MAENNAEILLDIEEDNNELSLETEEDNKTHKKTLTEWNERLKKAQKGHYIAAEGYSKNEQWLRVPAVVLSAFVSTSVIASFFEATPVQVNYLAGGLSIISTLLLALLSSTRVEEKSHAHERSAAKYGKLSRSIERFLASGKKDTEADSFQESLQNGWDLIADDSPVTPQWARKKIK